MIKYNFLNRFHIYQHLIYKSSNNQYLNLTFFLNILFFKNNIHFDIIYILFNQNVHHNYHKIRLIKYLQLIYILNQIIKKIHQYIQYMNLLMNIFYSIIFNLLDFINTFHYCLSNYLLNNFNRFMNFQIHHNFKR